MEQINYLKESFIIKYNKEFVKMSFEPYSLQKPGHLDWILKHVVDYPYFLNNKYTLLIESNEIIGWGDINPIIKKEKIIEKASFLLFHLASGHVFLEANKRISLFILITFIRLNGFDVKDSRFLLDHLFLKINSKKPSTDILFNLVINLAGCEEKNGKKENVIKFNNPKDIKHIVAELVI
jgi:hypothetical protein